MKQNTAVKMPELPAKVTQAPVPRNLENYPDCNTSIEMVSRETSSEISINGRIASYKSKQLRIIRKIEIFNEHSPAADRAWEEYHSIEDTIDELEASLEVAA